MGEERRVSGDGNKSDGHENEQVREEIMQHTTLFVYKVNLASLLGLSYKLFTVFESIFNL